MARRRHIAIDGGEAYLGFALSRLRVLSAQADRSSGHANQIYFPEGEAGPRVQVRVSPNDGHVFLSHSPASLLCGLVGAGASQSPSDLPLYARFHPSSLHAALTKKERAWRSEPKLFAPAFLNPNLFTGRMEKVAQLLLGMPDRPRLYQHRWLKTHGVHAAQNGLWLIEISERGVLARPLTGGALPKGPIGDGIRAAGVPLLPDGSSFPEAADALEAAVLAGSVRRLLPPESMAPALGPGKHNLFRDCSWAFSESGAKASNVSVFREADKTVKSSLFTVSISGDETGPTSAALVEEQTGLFFHLASGSDAGSLAGCYFPGQSAGDERTVNFDFSESPWPLAELSGPLYAYYLGEQLQLWRCHSHTVDGERFYGAQGPGLGPQSDAPDRHFAQSYGIERTTPGNSLFQISGSAKPAPSYLSLPEPPAAPPIHRELYDTGAYYKMTLAETLADHYFEPGSSFFGSFSTRRVRFSPTNRSCVYALNETRGGGGGGGGQRSVYARYAFDSLDIDPAWDRPGLADEMMAALDTSFTRVRDGGWNLSLQELSASNPVPFASTSALTVKNHAAEALYAAPDGSEGSPNPIGWPLYGKSGFSAFLGSSYHAGVNPAGSTAIAKTLFSADPKDAEPLAISDQIYHPAQYSQIDFVGAWWIGYS